MTEVIVSSPVINSDRTQHLDVSDVKGAAPIDSPEFKNNARSETPPQGDISERIATTAFVVAAILSGIGITELSRAQVENPKDETLGSVTGERLGQSVFANVTRKVKLTVTSGQAVFDLSSLEISNGITAFTINGVGYESPTEYQFSAGILTWLGNFPLAPSDTVIVHYI